jgi:transcriptional regulator with PAS, ATPase and Fis domain
VKTPLPPLLGSSPAIRRALQLVDRYAPTTLSILVVGPTGTGKELVARHVHARSRRVGHFVPVNCGALPREMTESLLFGHRRGAFSGAVESRRGHVERADRGTLFLDEVLCLSPEGQTKVLRALDTGEIQPLGEEGERFVDLRVVAAAQESVWVELDDGTFRSDLYQRIAGVVVVLPPLAERAEDILPIARYFTELAGRSLEAGADRVLERHAWPGNVRELRQVIERAGQLVENGTLPPGALVEAIHLGARPGAHRAGSSRREDLLAVCQSNEWDVQRIAAALGVRRTQLYARLRAAGTSLRELRKSGLSGGRPADEPDIRGEARA